MAFFVDVDEGNRGFEDGSLRVGVKPGAKDADAVMDRGISEAFPLDGQAEDLAVLDAVTKLDVVEGDGDEAVAGEFVVGGDVDDFIDPFEHEPAEKAAVVV